MNRRDVVKFLGLSPLTLAALAEPPAKAAGVAPTPARAPISAMDVEALAVHSPLLAELAQLKEWMRHYLADEQRRVAKPFFWRPQAVFHLPYLPYSVPTNCVPGLSQFLTRPLPAMPLTVDFFLGDPISPDHWLLSSAIEALLPKSPRLAIGSWRDERTRPSLVVVAGQYRLAELAFHGEGSRMLGELLAEMALGLHHTLTSLDDGNTWGGSWLDSHAQRLRVLPVIRRSSPIVRCLRCPDAPNALRFSAEIELWAPVS